MAVGMGMVVVVRVEMAVDVVGSFSTSCFGI